jgi:hypothetical protein
MREEFGMILATRLPYDRMTRIWHDSCMPIHVGMILALGFVAFADMAGSKGHMSRVYGLSVSVSTYNH